MRRTTSSVKALVTARRAILAALACVPLIACSARPTATLSAQRLTPSGPPPIGPSGPPGVTPTPLGAGLLYPPSLTRLDPPQARPGAQVVVEGIGGHVSLAGGGFIESQRSFGLYLDLTLVGVVDCYVNACRGAFAVPASARPGPHTVSAEGGSSLTLDVLAP